MIVWTNGCFDVLHRGHIEMFEYASSLGERLVVGIDSDARVSLSKGPSRPINSQEDRKKMLEAIRFIDKVVIFNDDEDLRNAIRESNTNILVVGSDWEGKKVIGSECAGEVRFFERIGDYSTTNVLERINDGVCV